MTWSIIIGSFVWYFGIGTLCAVQFARKTYETDRKRYPSLAQDNPRVGMAEAYTAFFAALFLWPFVMSVQGISWGISWFMTHIVLPTIHEHDQQEEIEERKQHIREMERGLLDTHKVSDAARGGRKLF